MALTPSLASTCLPQSIEPLYLPEFLPPEVVYPLDFARTRLAVDVGSGKQREFTGTVDCILKTAKASGWGRGGVYNGFVVSCVGIVFYRGAYFGLYDTINDQDFMRNGSFLIKFAVGYTVTVVAGLLSYPLDTIRRRMMMTSGSAVHYKSMFDAGSQIIAKEGTKSLFKGAAANILRGVAGAGVLSLYDQLQVLMFGKVYSGGSG